MSRLRIPTCSEALGNAESDLAAARAARAGLSVDDQENEDLVREHDERIEDLELDVLVARLRQNCL